MADRITLITKEGDEMKVDPKIFRSSKTIMSKLAGLGPKDKKLFHVPEIRCNTLLMIIDWLLRHKNDPFNDSASEYKHVDQQDMGLEIPGVNISDWDFDFFDVEPCLFVELVFASAHLQIKELGDMLREVFKLVCKDKSQEEMEEVFKFGNFKRRDAEGAETY